LQNSELGIRAHVSMLKIKLKNGMRIALSA